MHDAVLCAIAAGRRFLMCKCTALTQMWQGFHLTSFHQTDGAWQRAHSLTEGCMILGEKLAAGRAHRWGEWCIHT